MAEITVEEKAPGYRLDHPDFGVVSRVTYAKGVITKMKKSEDLYPMKMEAAAKVKVDDIESDDYIPIFFRPKEKYWDTQEVQSQDIDQEGKRYKNAWMSFRGDDEVKVMLVDGKPFAIVGFLDGVPRLGEAVFKIQVNAQAAWDPWWPEDWQSPYMDAASALFTAIPTLSGGEQDWYYEPPEPIGLEGDHWAPDLDLKGPDDKDLKLLQACPKFFRDPNENSVHYNDPDYGVPQTYWSIVNSYYWNMGSGGWFLDVWWKQVIQSVTQECTILVPIGPVLYRIKFAILKNQVWDTLHACCYHTDVALPGDQPPRPWQAFSTPTNPDPRHRQLGGGSAIPEGDTPADAVVAGGYTLDSWGGLPWEDLLYASAVGLLGKSPLTIMVDGGSYNWGNGQIYFPAPGAEGAANELVPHAGEVLYQIDATSEYDADHHNTTVSAALYKEALMSDPDSEEFVAQGPNSGQEDFSNQMMHELVYTYWIYCPDCWGNMDAIDVFVRPHTKAELQAAGMWPGS